MLATTFVRVSFAAVRTSVIHAIMMIHLLNSITMHRGRGFLRGGVLSGVVFARWLMRVVLVGVVIGLVLGLSN